MITDDECGTDAARSPSNVSPPPPYPIDESIDTPTSAAITIRHSQFELFLSETQGTRRRVGKPVISSLANLGHLNASFVDEILRLTWKPLGLESVFIPRQLRYSV